ncbi:cobalamin-binding protein [Mucilaginibacter sp. PAMC 26640]|nr:cobalamin-binding protein [Mucilaginibacter sp. PAMC 26640]
MPIFYDQMKRAVNIPFIPKRIISLVPSQTELLFFLGLDSEIVGLTKFCIHPAGSVSDKAAIGGTKQLNMAAIYQLKPDLIIANKEENEQAQVEELMKNYPVWISDINDIDSALKMIIAIGSITGKEEEAKDLILDIINQFESIIKPTVLIRTAYLIWRNPYMAVGQGTFINSLFDMIGLTNVFSQGRYPQITLAELRAADPQLLLLSSEPYPFSEKHIAEFRILLPNARILLVNGELFSWYGSRLLQAPAYFNMLIAGLR